MRKKKHKKPVQPVQAGASVADHSRGRVFAPVDATKDGSEAVRWLLRPSRRATLKSALASSPRRRTRAALTHHATTA